ncbi:MAG TPA: TRAP transporter small permease [archaeon]|nr:TRAP transporter small permease [archaeon]
MWAKIKKGLDLVLETGLWLAMLSEVLTVIWQVFTRFVLRDPSSWTEELAIFLLIWIGLLGSAVALNRNAHLGIDILVNRFPRKWGHLAAVFANACIILFSLSVLFYGGIKLVAVILMNNQISPALGIRQGYVYLALPISGFFITIYAVEFLVVELKALFGKEEPVEERRKELKVMLD